jgi:hypothetical protein
MTAQKLWGNNATDDKQQREQIRAFWRHLFAGSAAVRFHRYDKVPPEPFFHCVSAARKLADLIDLWETEPHPDRLTEREPDEAYLMADPGRSYAVYFPRRGSVELNLEDVSGTFTRQWIDITTGRFAEKDTVEGNAAVILSTPDRHSGWAVVLQKAGSER